MPNGGKTVVHCDRSSTTDGLLVAWNLGQFSHYELFFELAQAYFHAASVMFEEQLHAPYYFNLLPAMFCLNHGIECLLKGAILLGDASVTIEMLSSGSLGHNLGNLYRKYRQIYPSDQFRMPVRVEQLIRWTETAAQGVGGVFERYLFDKVGRLVKETGKDTILLDDTLDLLSELTRHCQWLEQEIRNSMGISARTCLEQNYSRIVK
jgi:hypothetical protein